MSALRDRLLATVGGTEAFERSFNWRTFSPAKRAEQALVDGVRDAEEGLAALSAKGVAADLAERWLDGYVRRWAEYQAAGARTANWMITGPARFPVERNRKAMQVEHARSLELSAYVSGAAEWARRQACRIDRAERVASDAGGHVEREVVGVRLVQNTTLDRVQLIFPDKPSADERAVLKRHAFRWAPSVGAWQRQLTRNGIEAAEAVLVKLTTATATAARQENARARHAAQPSGDGE